MFDFNAILFLLVVMPFAFIAIYQDLQSRKVKNVVTLLFLYISFLVLIYNFMLYSFIDYFVIVLSFGFAYFLYKKDIWGGADGKIFIGIVLILDSLANSVIFVSFLLNLLFFYTIGIIFLILFKTKFKTQLKVLKSIDTGFLLFYLFVIFLVVKRFLRQFMTDANPIFLLLFIVGVYFLIQKTQKFLRKFYYERSEVTQFFLVFGAALIYAAVSDLVVWVYFILIFLVRLSTQFFSGMTTFLKNSVGEKFYSPFTIYLFISALFSYFAQENIVSLILRLFN